MAHNVQTERIYNELIRQGLVIVDFHATWCGLCRMISTTFEQLATECRDIRFLKVNVSELSGVSRNAGVEGMPTFIAFKNGQKIGEVVGANESKIIELIQKLRSL